MLRWLMNRKKPDNHGEAFASTVPPMALKCQLLIGSCGGPDECRCVRPGECTFTLQERTELECNPQVVQARQLNNHWRESEKE